MSEPNFAELFERVLVPSIFRPWGNDLLDRIRPTSTERVLDVACGTGILGRLVRERCGAATRIAGVDINPLMIVTARSIAPDIEWHEGNAQKLPFPDAAFDLVLCQQGLQFFPDRALAVREMRRVLSPGGRVALTTWRPLAECLLFNGLHKLAVSRFGPHEDRRFSFGDGEAICALLAAAGFTHVRTQTVKRIDHITDARTFVTMNLEATVDGLDEMKPEERTHKIAQFHADAEGVLAPFSDGDIVVNSVAANVVTARV